MNATAGRYTQNIKQKASLQSAIPKTTHLFMMDDLVQVGLELLGQQNSFQASGGDAPPVEVLHPQSTSEL